MLSIDTELKKRNHLFIPLIVKIKAVLFLLKCNKTIILQEYHLKILILIFLLLLPKIHLCVN